MANEQNLIPGGYRLTQEEQSRGGKASGRARRLKKHGRELMLALLAMREPDPRIVAELQQLGIDPRDITKEVAMQARQIEKAIKKGDTKAFREVNRIAGYLDETATMDLGVKIQMTLPQEAIDGLSHAIETGAMPRPPKDEQ